MVGDIHASKTHLTNAVARAVDLSAHAIVQVGDFWLTDRHWSRFGPKQAEYMAAACESPLSIVVIDGNHEAWPALGRYAPSPAAREASQTRHPLHLGRSPWWAWRGSIWHWNGCALGALGGAVSPDRRFPQVRHYRWPTEVTQEDFDRHVERRRGVRRPPRHAVHPRHPAQVHGLISGMRRIPLQTLKATDDGRRLLAGTADRTQPPYVLHGHWHQANREGISDGTEVVGLAEDGSRDHTALLQTQPVLEVSYV